MTEDRLKNPTVILRRPCVEARTGLKRSTIYERMREGTFPLPFKLGEKSVGWLESEIEAWIAEQVKKSRGGAA